MSRSISLAILVLLMIFVFGGVATAQDFVLRENDPKVVELSAQTKEKSNVFEDRNNDGIYDAATIGGKLITGNIRMKDAQGFQYEDGRYITVYPSDWTGLPKPGTAQLLGFMHYFDTKDMSTYLAIIAEQAQGDDTSNGLGIFFYDSSGLRVGAPTTMRMEKAQLRSIPIYQQWVQTATDFGIGSNPLNSQFFVYAKDLGLTDTIIVVMMQLYQQ